MYGTNTKPAVDTSSSVHLRERPEQDLNLDLCGASLVQTAPTESFSSIYTYDVNSWNTTFATAYLCLFKQR